MELEGLKAALDEAREIFHIPSYSVTVFADGSFTHLSAGHLDVEKNLSADSNTLYAIGSCTKSFVAGTVCTLADRGLLSLDDCLKEYLPEFEMDDSYVSTHLTIRDMLCHRCGLPRHDLSYFPRLETMTEKDVIATLRYLRPNQPFRYKFQYNNQMYALAGCLIERVTGDRWQDTLRRSILEPLGIVRVAFNPGEAAALGCSAVPSLYDKANNEHRTVAHADIGALSPSGCMYMTAADLAKWVAVLAGGGTFDGVQVLSKELCAEMHSVQMVQGNGIVTPLKGVANNSGYGLGLMTEVYRGRRLVHHGGHINGFMADLSYLPDEGFGCAVLTNLGQVRAAMAMRYVIMEHYLGGTVNWSKTLSEFYAEESRKREEAASATALVKQDKKPCPVPPEEISGTYSNPGYGEIRITADGDSLSVQLGALVLTGSHYTNQYFYLKEQALLPGFLIEACLELDVRGNITGFSAGLEPESREKIHFIRQNNA